MNAAVVNLIPGTLDRSPLVINLFEADRVYCVEDMHGTWAYNDVPNQDVKDAIGFNIVVDGDDIDVQDTPIRPWHQAGTPPGTFADTFIYTAGTPFLDDVYQTLGEHNASLFVDFLGFPIFNFSVDYLMVNKADLGPYTPAKYNAFPRHCTE